MSANAEEKLLSAQIPRRKRMAKLSAGETMGQLQLTIVNARNVSAMHRGGTSDPYVEVSVNAKTQTSSVQKDALKPTWNETFTWNRCDWNRSFFALHLLSQKFPE